MQKYEYKSVRVQHKLLNEIDKILNLYGQNGFQLDKIDDHIFIFKRLVSKDNPMPKRKRSIVKSD